MAENEKAGGDYTPQTPEERRRTTVDIVRRGLEECGNLKWSHYADLMIRRDGKDIHVEADWLKYVEDVCPEVKPGERERCVISDLPPGTLFLDKGERHVLIDNSSYAIHRLTEAMYWPTVRLRDGEVVLFLYPDTEVEILEKPVEPKAVVAEEETTVMSAPHDGTD